MKWNQSLAMTFALLGACEQGAPIIIEDQPLAPHVVEAAPPPIPSAPLPPGAFPPPVGPPIPVLDDGTPIAPPALPPGMKQDPNGRDIVSLYTRFCSDCHGDNGAGKISGAPNFIDYPQGLNNADGPMIEKVLEGHGGAPPAKEEFKPRTVFHLIDFMRARVGMARAVRAVEDYNKQQMAPKDPAPGTK